MLIKQGKTNWKYILIVLILAIVVGGGVLFYQKTRPTFRDEVVPVDVSDWKTYRNEEYGFEFKYPKEFDTYKGCELEEEKNGYTFGLDVIFRVRVGSRIELSILDSQGLTLSEYAYKEFPKVWEEIDIETTNGQILKRTFVESRENINIGGEEAIRVRHRSGGTGRYGEGIFLLKSNKIYQFSVFTGVTCSDLEEAMKKQNLSIFDHYNQMLSTLRFLDEEELITLTEVIRYVPTAAPDETYEGSCWIDSLAARRSDAWRCNISSRPLPPDKGNLVDPCFVLDSENLVCDPDPSAGDKGILLKLTEPLPGVKNKDRFGEGWGWLVELEDGNFCGPVPEN